MFAFHLLSGSDLQALKNANGHFGNDILTSLLNEPIEGHGVFWTSASTPKTTYPIPFRAFNFGTLYRRLNEDEKSRLQAEQPTYAMELHGQYGSKSLPTIESVAQVKSSLPFTPVGKSKLLKGAKSLLDKVLADKDFSRLDKGESRPFFVLENVIAKQ